MLYFLDPDDTYWSEDHFICLTDECRERRSEKKQERKEKQNAREQRRNQRQATRDRRQLQADQRRELRLEKLSLKNDSLRSETERSRAEVNTINQVVAGQQQAPPPVTNQTPTSVGNLTQNNTLLYGVGAVILLGVGYMVLKPRRPMPAAWQTGKPTSTV